MITSLSIKNYALIEDLNIDFSDGFTVISGETGSGKSILIRCIELLTGARADSSAIRSGCSSCSISGEFECKDENFKNFLAGLCVPFEENSLLIRRTIESNGKSKAFVNDLQVSISALSSIGEFLIDFHAQDKKRSLLDKDWQLEALDGETEESYSLLEKLRKIYDEVRNIKSNISHMNLSEEERLKKIDLYSFQSKEIEEAAIQTGEEAKLEAELPKLKNAEKISQAAQEAAVLLYRDDNSVLSGLLKIKKIIGIINSYGACAQDAVSLIEQAYYQTEEVYRETEKILSDTDIEPEKLNYYIERMELIKKLKKKYGSTIEEINEYKNKIDKELVTLNNHKDGVVKLEKELAEKEKELNEVCKNISQKRQKAAITLAKKIQEQLFDLDIKTAVFNIEFHLKAISANGYDDIDFMFCANKGEKVLPLRSAASGGELSRILLAVELSLKKENNQTSVFDEIDAGTGGKTGEKIGKKLWQLAKSKQVFSITHLAQAAAFAKTHIKIYKETEGARTFSKAKILSQDEHIEEIARMISGEQITKAAIEHAKDLVKNSLQTTLKT
ncbi:MAG: DNA repair protein RecN [Elusimicrobiota bacterium]|jgi:DNA repair protein RecN (Recombination protein N)|nr:DNA repair protein RecN [Elusimicrobiota bacterium]